MPKTGAVPLATILGMTITLVILAILTTIVDGEGLPEDHTRVEATEDHAEDTEADTVKFPDTTDMATNQDVTEDIPVMPLISITSTTNTASMVVNTESAEATEGVEATERSAEATESTRSATRASTARSASTTRRAASTARSAAHASQPFVFQYATQVVVSDINSHCKTNLVQFNNN